ncbi:fatty-acid amide hydrolase [Mytilinidion resinicola]|uniref:amidase n=1 Tax=Mytilinidion resinicola TaxID=574789 RepID=A0A6A6YX20_9PEZI|nr:fatty-acid amide hydrolase [Mytilinidion resinicola]KAF2813069.1 fatty-acid amide hydrolase [Mytilinidion resinicola]
MTEIEDTAWAKKATAKRAALTQSIPPAFRIPADILPPETQLDISRFPAESKWFTAEELEITSTTAPALLERIANKAWSAEDVIKAFCKRAAAAHQLTNCLTEVFFDEAIETAKALDKHLAKTGKTIGPLHGLPISLKDNFNLIGKDSTVGFTSWVNDPQTYNSTLVELLRDAGAVFYVKTNVPTAMMIAETVNNVFGRTVNPLNRALTSGGSSGGESALIVFGGSPLGIGTDIGGSLRIPAACTGIFTLRPSLGRFPTLRARSGLAGQEAVASVNGPMGKTLDDIVLFSKTVVGLEPWMQDPKCLPIPWRSVEPKTKLKIGVIWNDGIVTPTPPVQRALRETVEKLKKAGHEVIDWDASTHKQAVSLIQRMFVADGGKSVRHILKPTDEPFRPEMSAYASASEMGVHDLWQLHLERTDFQKAYLDQWNFHGMDALLGPTTPYASVESGKFKHVGYTGTFNVLDYSAVSFPCGVIANKEVDQYGSDYRPMTETDKEIRDEYNEGLVHGMPVSLQLIARRLEEEKVLAMTKTVLEAL